MAAENNVPLSGNVLLYNRPEPLDAERHAKLGMRRSETPFSFAASQHFIPLHVGEFGPAGANYPIIFAGEAFAPLAVMGLQDGENLYIDAHGAYRPGCYIPAFIRRYPFVGARDEAMQRMVICIDRESDLWTESNPDVMLFENGQPTDFTKSCIEFCSQFDQVRLRTESFTQMLKDLDLFETKQTTFTPRDANGVAGQPVLIAEYYAISEAKLNALPQDKLVELRDNGALSQIYAHLNSLFGWDRLIAESMARNNAAQAIAGHA
ncbi:MAG: SapC family protein [Caulobacteraceae bacterium]|nr:SapC family protein [Caulobacteraceae bacterium]